MCSQHRFAHIQALGKVIIGGDDVHHLNAGVLFGKDFFHALHPLVQVGHDQRSCEDRHLALATQRLGHHLGLLAPGRTVVGTIVRHPHGVRRVRVKGHHRDPGLFRLGDHRLHRCRLQRCQPDAVHPLVDQVLQDLHLLGRVSGGRRDPLVLHSVHPGRRFLQTSQYIVVERVRDLGHHAKNQLLRRRCLLLLFLLRSRLGLLGRFCLLCRCYLLGCLRAASG